MQINEDVDHHLRSHRARSVAQASEHGHSLLDPVPVLVLLLHGQPDVEDEVRRVAGGRKSTCPSRRLVDRALVRVAVVDLGLLLREHPNGLHLREEYLRHRFFECFFLLIPSAALDKESVDEDAIFCRLGQVIFGFIRNDLEIKVNRVDGDHVLSGEVLLCACQERLRKIEARDPEDWRRAVVNPILNEFQACQEILNP